MVDNPVRMKPGPRKLSSRPVFGTEKVAVEVGLVGVSVNVSVGTGVLVGISVEVGVAVGS